MTLSPTTTMATLVPHTGVTPKRQPGGVNWGVVGANRNQTNQRRGMVSGESPEQGSLPLMKHPGAHFPTNIQPTGLAVARQTTPLIQSQRPAATGLVSKSAIHNAAGPVFTLMHDHD